MNRAALLDYGTGNLHSLARALAEVGCVPQIFTDLRSALRTSDRLVLPGVGAFGPAAALVRPMRALLCDAAAAGFPILGICLGMQLLFGSSDEGPGVGLSLFEGRVTRIRAPRVPHIGWTTVGDLGDMYFAHSFACRPVDSTCVGAWVELEGDRVPALVKKGSVVGTQFHPEKSSRAGLRLLRELVS